MDQNNPYQQYDVIALHNIDDEDFVFEFDKSSGNLPYTIPAGEVRRFPKFIARHGLKHLVDKILIKNGKTNQLNLQAARDELGSQIVVDEEKFSRGEEKSKTQQLKEEVERMNKPSDLDNILAKHKPKKDKKAKEINPKSEIQDVPKVEEKFEGLDDKKVVDTTDTTEDKPKMRREDMPVPTKRDIYMYAVNILGMTIGEKEKKLYDKMTVKTLLKELGDPRDA